ncbi:MAG: cysteine desulfurase [Candidatus Saccharicenans sp.]|nr:cysteine desulfurase [Candidatus Saccharicenans sp.]MDH7493113.1 cysteine desulfurase family protein [Candidatus Saccharicenans sp.]
MPGFYADKQAAAPVRPEVLEAMLPFFSQEFGNPQSLHSVGQKAARALSKAREQLARLINCRPEEIVFVASGSEANNLALKGLALANQARGQRVIVSAIEHISVLRATRFLEKLGFRITQVPVDGSGLVSPEKVAEALTPDTVLVSVMMANNEVGTIEPVTEIARLCQSRGIIFHSDAVAAVGNIPVDVSALGVDALSLAADQFGGPKGAGALFLKKGTKITPLIDGGLQENNRRAGTENVPAIVGLGQAAELAAREMAEKSARLSRLRDRLIAGVLGSLDEVILTGHPVNRLPHHASFCVKFVEGEAMLLGLDLKDIQVASGSACTSRSLRTSHVLTAMGIDPAVAQGSLVLTLFDGTSDDQLDYFLENFPPVVRRLRELSPLYTKYRQEKKDVHG